MYSPASVPRSPSGAPPGFDSRPGRFSSTISKLPGFAPGLRLLITDTGPLARNESACCASTISSSRARRPVFSQAVIVDPEPPKASSTVVPVWFRAMWWLTTQKNGAGALGLQRVLGLKSYETAWTWLHKLRRAMVRPRRELLTGRVEVDECYVGGLEEGLPGRLNLKKALVVVAAHEIGESVVAGEHTSHAVAIVQGLADSVADGNLREKLLMSRPVRELTNSRYSSFGT